MLLSAQTTPERPPPLTPAVLEAAARGSLPWLAPVSGFLCGAGFLFFGDKLSTDGFYGNILAIISGVTSAIMMVSFRAQKDGNPAESNLIAFIATTLVGFPFILNDSWTANSVIILVFLGVVQIGFAFIFFTKGIKHIPALEANLIGTLEPVLNPIWVFFFYGESVGRFAILGGLVVLVGVILSAAGSARADKQGAQKVTVTL